MTIHQPDFLAAEGTSLSLSLSPEQIAAVDGIITGEISIVHGAAGTGKSEVIAAVAHQLGSRCVVLCPTHKAANNLRERGVKNVYQIDGLKVTSVQIKMRDNKVTHIIVDESSMVGDESRTLIEAASRRAGQKYHVCYVGDPRQLPPVSRGAWTHGDDWFASAPPGYVLTKSFRRAHWFAPRVVESLPLDHKATHITMTNAKRREICIALHERKHGVGRAYLNNGKAYLRLHRGDKLACYTNSRGNGNKSPLRNNCLITVTGVEYTRANGKAVYRVSYEESQKPIDIPKTCFKTAHYLDPDAPKQEFELAYAITAHSAQGSGYDNVVVHLDRFRDEDGSWTYPLADTDAQRWLYTAITRAKKSVTVVDPTGAIKDDNLDLRY